MVVWGGLSCPAGAGDGKQDLGRASRGRCCPANLPPGRREAPPPWLCLGFPGLLGLGCKPSTAWTHSPERLALQVLGYQHRSLENFISHACSCCSECCLLGSWQFNELLGIKNVSVLYPSAYFYGNPYLVGTLELVMSGSNCKGNARASHRRGTSAAPEQSKSKEMPWHQWWPTEEHLTLLGLHGLELLQYALYLLFHSLAQAQAACWTLSGNQQYRCTTQQFGNTLKIPPLAFQCEHSLLTTWAQISLLSDGDWHLLLEREAFIWKSYQILEWFICYLRLFSFPSSQIKQLLLAWKTGKAGRVREMTTYN